MKFTKFLLVFLSVGFLFLSNILHAADNVQPLQDEVKEWVILRNLMFGAKAVTSGENSTVRLSVNKDLDDASTVPILIEGLVDQKNNRFIKKLYLIVDQNPIPTAAIFEMSPSKGSLHLETRLRIEKFTYVRAVAEMSDGELFMDQKWVEVKGGCSAPAGKNAGIDPLLGKMKFKLDKYKNSFKDADGKRTFRVELDQPNLLKVQVRHPNESAMASDLDADASPNFIQKIRVGFDEKELISAEVNFSISDNPAFMFHFAPEHQGELSFSIRDTHENQYVDSVSILGPKSN
jgi:sulfur-oxidizing protein SoxY